MDGTLDQQRLLKTAAGKGTYKFIPIPCFPNLPQQKSKGE